MTPFEAKLLSDSMSDLTGTLQRNRSLDIQERGQSSEDALRRDIASQRHQEFQATREDRAAAQKEAQANRQALQSYHEKMLAAKTDDQKFQVFQDLLKSGTATQETLDNMSKAMSEKLGVEVVLKLPAAKPAFNTREGHNLDLAERYRERANAARRNGAGDEAERYQSIADRLERGGSPADEEMADITEDGPANEETGKPSFSVRRKVPTARLDEEMQRLRGGAAPAAPAMPTAGEAPEGVPAGMEQALTDRAGAAARGATGAAAVAGGKVLVVAPNGQRGTIPASQLQQALKEGYKLAQ